MRRLQPQAALLPQRAGQEVPGAATKLLATWRATSPRLLPTVTPGGGGKEVEMLFADLKCILRLDCLRLRAPCGAHDEFLLAAIVQNLRN